MIKHAPLFDTDLIGKYYTEKDGVPVTYVCTSELKTSDVPMDIFYRETPHPEFGNRYFGMYMHPLNNRIMITNADVIEDLEFGMVQDKDGDYWYSQCHHDCLFIDGNMIDGGRQYIKHSGHCDLFKVKDGEMIRSVFVDS